MQPYNTAYWFNGSKRKQTEKNKLDLTIYTIIDKLDMWDESINTPTGLVQLVHKLTSLLNVLANGTSYRK